MRPFYRKDLFRDEIIKIMPKELMTKVDQGDKKLSTLRMEKGQSITLNSEEYEVALVILSGTAKVITDDFKAENKTGRKDVFSGQPTVIYIPRQKEYTIIATGYGLLEIALCMGKTDEDSEAFMIVGEEIVRQNKGVFNWQRGVNEILTPETAKEKCHLTVGEVYGCPGPWAIYPYGDDTREIVFFFKFAPNPGKKLQVMGSEESDQGYYVEHDSALIMDTNYLPIAKIDDYQVYALWFKTDK